MPASSATPGSQRALLVLLAAYAIFLTVYGITSGELYRNEGLRALVAAETLRTGNWLVPTLHGEPFLTKPPGMTIAIAGMSWPLGHVTEWSARLPSVLAALISILAFFAYFRGAFGFTAGCIAAAILPASFYWLDRVPSAEIDMFQLAWVTGATLAFLKALEVAEERPTQQNQQSVWWVVALLCVTGGWATKWTAPAFFYMTVLPVLWWRGRLTLLACRGHLLGVFLALVLAGSWITLVVATTGAEAFFDTVSREGLMRLSPGHHPRPYPWRELIEFPTFFLAGNLPWSFIALISLHPRFRAGLDDRGLRTWQTLQCWLWVNLVFWTVLPGHRPRHCLPLQPAIAGLAALAWISWCKGSVKWPVSWCRPIPMLLGVLALFLAVKVAFVNVWAPTREPDKHWREKGAELAAIIPVGESLGLNRLKDEGLLFYVGRPTRRLLIHDDMSGPHYWLLTKDEWQSNSTGRGELLLETTDGQGADLYLVHFHGR